MNPDSLIMSFAIDGDAYEVHYTNSQYLLIHLIPNELPAVLAESSFLDGILDAVDGLFADVLYDKDPDGFRESLPE